MAGKIPRSFIDELIARVDLVDLIDARVPLKKTGANYQARCPFHTEKSPSFNVNREKQFYHCFGCGASGNAISFLMDYERQSFVEAVETLADLMGMSVPRESYGGQPKPDDGIQPLYDIQAQAAEFYARQLKQHPEAQRAREYLKNRGLNGEIAQRFQLGYAPPGWRSLPESLPQASLLASGLSIAKEGGGGYYDRFRDRIIFPIRDRRGRVIGFGGRVMGDEKPKYLNSPETPTFKKNKEVYGLHELLATRTKPERILIVEGYMDVIALAQHGIPYVVATLGTATSTDHANLLFRYARELVFCFDGDEAGRNAAWKALEASLPTLKEGRSIRFLMLPQTHDPDSLVRAEGQQAFEQRISQAQPLSDYFFEHLAENLALESLEGRASLHQQAAPLLTKLPEGVFQNLMRDRLAKLSGQDIPKGKNAFRPSNAKPSNYNRPRTERAKPSNLRILLAMLVQNPQLFACITAEAREELEQEEKAGEFCKKLFTILHESPNLNYGGLWERFRGEPEEKLIQSLNQLETPALSGEELVAEFRTYQDKFVQQAQHQFRDHRLEWLNQKAASIGFAQLDPAEKDEYRRLMNPKST